ncbi:hypothetical protein AGMMS49975_14020 [Clostridia bacterium]|nr:hypothetical protein AGMMS49975_14020 [Clostridia bacterium]GHU76419.1 hypothetical protein FACS1894188_08910 [Clostridia bacterium]
MGKTSTEVKDRYNKNAYDTTIIRFRKGDKDIIEAVAAETGTDGISGYIKRALTEKYERDTGKAYSFETLGRKVKKADF